MPPVFESLTDPPLNIAQRQQVADYLIATFAPTDTCRGATPGADNRVARDSDHGLAGPSPDPTVPGYWCGRKIRTSTPSLRAPASFPSAVASGRSSACASTTYAAS